MRKQLLRLRKRGFTLPEVLVTVTVVAVLAAVVVPAVTQYVGRGNAPATANDLNTLRTAVQGFITDMRVYPQNIADLTGTSAPTYASVNGGVWHGPYLSGTASNTTTGATGQGLNNTGATQCYPSTCSSSFSSAGMSLALADTIISTNGTLQAVIISPYACSAVHTLDSLLDDNSATTGLLTYTAPGTCDASHNVSNARITLVTVGK